MTTQAVNIQRVRANIASLVSAFIAERLRTNPVFFISELYEYVSQNASVAPASSDRILRLLKREGAIDYEVISRAKSQYRVLSVRVVQRELFA